MRRSVGMMRALYEAYGTLLAFDGRELFCFWEPEVVGQAAGQDLRNLEMGYRAKSIKKVTEAFMARQISEEELRGKSIDEQSQVLLRLYGIGPASVGHILFDVFHRWSELSHISLWEQRIYSRLILDRDTDDPAPVEGLLLFFERHFEGAKMLAVHCLWGGLFWRGKHESITWLENLIRL